MSSKSQDELVTEVRDRLDEATATFWSDVQLRKWINEACRDVSRRTETLLSTDDVTVTAGTQQYSGPADTVRVSRAEWRPTDQVTIYPLEYKDYNGMDAIWWTSQAVSSGYPSFFTMWGFPPSLTLVLYPVPSTGGVCRLFYYRLAAELSTDGTQGSVPVEVLAGWEDLIVDYAEFIALRKDGDQRWQEAKQIYEERLRDLFENSRRWADAAGSLEWATQSVPAWLYGWEGGN